jgi:hypothetical protein
VGNPSSSRQHPLDPVDELIKLFVQRIPYNVLVFVENCAKKIPQVTWQRAECFAGRFHRTATDQNQIRRRSKFLTQHKQEQG